jgi:hypothetical protein
MNKLNRFRQNLFTPTIASEENNGENCAPIDEGMTRIKSLIERYPIVLSTPVHGFTGHGFKTWKQAISFMKKTRCVYEDYDGLVKPYLDYDQKIEYVPTVTNIIIGSMKIYTYKKKDRDRFVERMKGMADK